MKRIKLNIVIILILIVSTGSNVFSQQGRGLGPCGLGFGPGGSGYGPGFQLNYRLLDLTDDQIIQMNDIRKEQSDQIIDLNTEYQKLRLDYRSLLMADKKDVDAINENIDKQTELQSKIMKMNVQFRTKIEDVLTDEQKELLGTRIGMGLNRNDNIPGRGLGQGQGRGYGRGYRQGFGRGAGRGYGRGYGRGFGAGSGW